MHTKVSAAQVFFLSSEDHFKSSSVLSLWLSVVFLYDIILKLNYPFLSGSAFSPNDPEVITASFLLHTLETCIINESWDPLPQKWKIFE